MLAMSLRCRLVRRVQAFSQTQEIRIAHIHDKTGPFEAYAKQSSIGLMMGFEYATSGTMEVLGRKLKITERDSQNKPDVGRAELAAAFGDDKADIAVGPTGSGVALAMLPIAEEYKKILLVDQAVADSITGLAWNCYIFRTARSSMQDAVANALVVGKPNTVIATLAPDYVFGRDAVKAFKEALAPTGAKIIHEEYVPIGTTDYTAAAERLFNALKGRAERKVIYIVPVAGNPFKIVDLNPQRFGIELAASGHTLDGLIPYKQVPGLQGATTYYYALPKNPINDWLVAEHQRRYNNPPDFYTAGSVIGAISIVEAMKQAGSTDAEKLIAAMEGMKFNTPKGEMTFRKEDHQALQSMYQFKIKADPNVAWGVPELVREIKANEMDIPLQVKR